MITSRSTTSIVARHEPAGARGPLRRARPRVTSSPRPASWRTRTSRLTRLSSTTSAIAGCGVIRAASSHPGAQCGDGGLPLRPDGARPRLARCPVPSDTGARGELESPSRCRQGSSRRAWHCSTSGCGRAERAPRRRRVGDGGLDRIELRGAVREVGLDQLDARRRCPPATDAREAPSSTRRPGISQVAHAFVRHRCDGSRHRRPLERGGAARSAGSAC